MEDRIVAALAILAVLTLIAGWFVTRKISERRRFKLRQSGRGKSTGTSTLEPAE
jgi:hypothetical protein